MRVGQMIRFTRKPETYQEYRLEGYVYIEPALARILWIGKKMIELEIHTSAGVKYKVRHAISELTIEE